MRKFLIMLVFVFSSMQISHSQTIIGDSIIASLLELTHFDQVIYYGQMLQDNITQIDNTVKQIEYAKNQAELAIKNISSADIKSWDDFTDWYNRQLYLERSTIEAFNNINVTIGKKQYNIKQIEEMPYAFKDSYVEYWNNEFTDQQRKEMWLGLGLTPANYAFVMPFREKVRNQIKADLFASDLRNLEYQVQMQKNKIRMDQLAADKDKEDKDKLGSKEVQMMTLETTIDTNKVINDMYTDQVNERQKKAAKDMLDMAPVVEVPFSDYPDKKENIGFRKLK